MKKIILDLDALTVESFETNDTEGVAGTVQAHGPGHPLRTFPEQWTCNRFQGTCDGCNEATIITYCGDPCSDTAQQYATCYDTCIWP